MFSISTWARFFCERTFINHLKSETKTNQHCALVSTHTRASHSMNSARMESLMVHIYFMAITLYCEMLYTTAINFLIFSSKKVTFIHKWDRWRCVVVVVVFFPLFVCLCVFLLCFALFGPVFFRWCATTSAAFIFIRPVAYKTWMIICVLYAGGFRYWIKPHNKKVTLNE